MRQKSKNFSKIKGNRYENAIALKIIAFFDLTRADCYRTPLSGGHRFDSKNYPSDLVKSTKLKQLFPYHISCKNVKWPRTLAAKMKLWLSWLDESVADLAKSNISDEIPIVIMHEAKGDDWVIIRESDFNAQLSQLTTYLKVCDCIVLSFTDFLHFGSKLNEQDMLSLPF